MEFESNFEAFECKNLNCSNEIRSILMQIWPSHKQLEPFEWKFQQFEMDSEHSNAYSNNLNQILSIWMRILTIRKGFEAFECKFYPFEPNSKYL